MFGISETQRNNASVPFAERDGAYTARAIKIVVDLHSADLERVRQYGVVPQHHLDAGKDAGFDEFLLAKAVREQANTLN